MEKIRKYAAEVGHQVVGKLTRQAEWEWDRDWISGEKKHCGSRIYTDEGGNEYLLPRKTGGVCIITADGGVI